MQECALGLWHPLQRQGVMPSISSSLLWEPLRLLLAHRTPDHSHHFTGLGPNFPPEICQ